jgi:outer membrane protein assembly factor BamB
VSWEFGTAGKIIRTPYLWSGACYVGDDQGFVYCLNAKTGGLIWKFRGAWRDDQIVRNGALISSQPVDTGILVHEGVAYFAIGQIDVKRHPTLLAAAHAKTGKLLWEQTFADIKHQQRPYPVWATGTFVPNGDMAMEGDHLYVPAKSGYPFKINVKKNREIVNDIWINRKLESHRLMTMGGKIMAGKLEVVHHMNYGSSNPLVHLPIVEENHIYMINQNWEYVIHKPKSGQPAWASFRSKPEDLCMKSYKREVWKWANDRYRTIVLKSKELETAPAQKREAWKAWRGQIMHVLIKVGGTLISGGDGFIYGTDAKTGKSLWKKKVPGTVADLAFCSGSLLVKTKDGSITCFTK